MRIYLDTCAYNRPFDDKEQITIQMEASAKLHIQDEIHIGKYELVWSYMNDFENSDNPYSERREAIQSDNAIRVEAIRILIQYLGAVNAERFVNSIKSDHFDYTEWQQNLWKDKTIDEIHLAAADFYNAKYDK